MSSGSCGSSGGGSGSEEESSSSSFELLPKSQMSSGTITSGLELLLELSPPPEELLSDPLEDELLSEDEPSEDVLLSEELPELEELSSCELEDSSPEELDSSVELLLTSSCGISSSGGVKTYSELLL